MRTTSSGFITGALITLLVGCYDDHGRRRELDASTSLDAEVVRDAGRDARIEMPSDAGSCASSSARVTVRVEALGVRSCEGEVLTGRLTARPEPEPEIDGVRFALDLCPDADEDCRCVLHLGGVGSDVVTRSSLTEGRFEARLDENSLVLIGAHEGGEAGFYEDELAFYAHDGELGGPSFAVEGVTWTAEEACRVEAEDGCRVVGYAADVVVDARAAGWTGWGEGGTVRLAEGETASVPGSFVTARLLRAHETSCAPGPTPPSPSTAAFVLVWSFPAAP